MNHVRSKKILLRDNRSHFQRGRVPIFKKQWASMTARMIKRAAQVLEKAAEV